MTVEQHIRALLDGARVPYEVLEHPPARDAEEAAILRGTPLGWGGKALVMKVDRGGPFVLLALPADRQVDNRALRRHLGLRRYRFAARDELRAVTGLEPGCIPPFGRPVLDLPLYADAALAANARIAFTPGVPERSLVVSGADWLALARPADVFAFAGPP